MFRKFLRKILMYFYLPLKVQNFKYLLFAFIRPSWCHALYSQTAGKRENITLYNMTASQWLKAYKREGFRIYIFANRVFPLIRQCWPRKCLILTHKMEAAYHLYPSRTRFHFEFTSCFIIFAASSVIVI